MQASVRVCKHTMHTLATTPVVPCKPQNNSQHPPNIFTWTKSQHRETRANDGMWSGCLLSSVQVIPCADCMCRAPACRLSCSRRCQPGPSSKCPAAARTATGRRQTMEQAETEQAQTARARTQVLPAVGWNRLLAAPVRTSQVTHGVQQVQTQYVCQAAERSRLLRAVSLAPRSRCCA